jgi:hypothetical protein
VRVAIQGNSGVASSINVFWAKITPSGTVTQADLDTWTAAFAAAYKARFARDLPTNFTFISATAVYFVDGTPLNVMESVAGMTGAGTGTSTKEMSTAAVISWLSGAYWRGGKPRTYIPCGAGLAGGTTVGTLSSTLITNLTADAAAFRGDINGLTAGTTIAATSLGFVSFFSANALRTTPIFFAFTGSKIHPRYSHQRRRDGKWVP